MWKTLPFEACIQKVKIPFKLPKKEYLAQGLYPVVSQEAALISGYHDDTSHLFNVDEPVVIFGDHTQALKYIDFSFVVGADGVKILKPISDIDAKYFYYALTTLMPKAKGYARHYKLLKELNISFPPFAEQQRIVAKLDAAFAEIDRAVELVEAKQANAERLKASLLDASLKGDDALCKTVKLGELFDVGSSKRVLKADWQYEGIPFYRGREITALSANGYVDNDLFITEEHYQTLLSKYGVPNVDDIMITAIGTIGNTYIVQPNQKFYFKDASVLWLRKRKDVSSNYIQYWLKTNEFFCQLDKGNGATVDTLTIKKLTSVVLPLPPLAEQKRIVAKLDAAFAKIETVFSTTALAKENYIALKSTILAQQLQPSEAA